MQYYNFVILFLFALQFPAYSQTPLPFKVNEVQLTTINNSDREKMRKAMKLFEIVMNDEAFQKKLMDTTFLFDVPNDPMRLLTSKQIADTLFAGREWYRPINNHAADVIWVCNKRKHKPPFSTTIGYGLPGDSVINTYIFHVRREDAAELAGHLAHEWSHKIGFDHLLEDHKDRDKTVPYIFGNLVKIFANAYLLKQN